MNFVSTKIVLQQIVLWCVLAAIVALLTLLFTVLGTITCAVVMGMMMAAIRPRPLRSLPISLVFPVVIVAMAHFAKVELPGRQKIVLPALCFTVFWVIYFATWALMRFESRHPSSPPVANAETAPSLGAELGPAAGELRLEDLQGKWRCETGPGGNSHTRVIEVAGRHLSLRLVAADGQARLLAEADLNLENHERSGKPATLPKPRSTDS